MPFGTVCPEPGFFLWFGAIVGWLFLAFVFVGTVSAVFLGRKP